MDTREVAALINEQGRLLKSRFGSIDGRLDDLEKRVLRPGGGSTQVSYTDADRRKLGEALRKAVSGDDSELKAMSVSPDNAGGYLAVSLLDREIRSIRDSVSPLSRMCREIIVDNGTAIEQPVIRGALPGAWVSEHDTRPETESLAVSQARVELHEVYCMPVVTQRLLDDCSYNVGDLLLEQIGHGLASLEDTAIHSGTGVGQPRGFLTHTTAATGDATRDWGTLEHVATGASGAFKAASASPADCLFDVVVNVG
jgi:HK97 family phage major capsid protein